MHRKNFADLYRKFRKCARTDDSDDCLAPPLVLEVGEGGLFVVLL